MKDSREQFSLIYDQYIEKIYRFVYVKVNSQETAEDITSKVFLKGWEAYQGGQEIKNPGAFLYQIARNMVTDYYRQKDRTKTASFDRIPEVLDSSMDIHQKATINYDIEQIKLAMLNLKKEYQDVLIWYYLEDMAPEKIAGLIDKPAGTVRVIIHRGLEALRGELIDDI